METRFTKKYLKWFYDIRVSRIKFHQEPSNENRITLEELQSVKWTKRAKYRRSYIESGGLTRACESLNLFNSQLNDFYSKLL